MKKLFIPIVILVIFLGCAGCKDYDKYSPDNYPLTKWQTEDEKIIIYVAEDGTCYGTIKTESEEIDVFYYLIEKDGGAVYRADNGLVIDRWYKKESSKDKFSCYIYDTFIYEGGTTFTVYKTEENLSSEDLPIMPEHPEEIRNISYINSSSCSE